MSDTHKFLSDTCEGIGHFVGIANHIGDVLTYYVLQDSTQKVIAHSMVCPLDMNNPNLRVYVPSDEGEGVEDDDNNDVNDNVSVNQHTENFLETEQTKQPVVRTLVETIHPDYYPENKIT